MQAFAMPAFPTPAFPETPSFRLDGKRALVTGASSGIGEAAAIALAQAGAHVFLAARRIEPMQATVDTLRTRGLQAEAIAMDVTDRPATRDAIARHGPFDILVNNAGRNTREPFLEVSDAALDAMLDLNIRAAFTVAQAVAQGMVQAGNGGAIINVGSVNGHVARETISVYVATKHAIEGLTKTMALELGRHGIRVNTLCPTWIATPLVRPMLDDPGTAAMMLSRLPIGRIGEVEDIMGVIVFLASPAAAMVTGAPLLVDGGQTTY
jgi:NAD(P)-dependent dehydrogenase (short-subunit alcohol dehydrogenase family)